MRKIGKRKQLICENCGAPFSIYIEAYEKLQREGKPIYCSVNCVNHQEKLDSSKLKQEIIVDDTENSFKFHYKEILQSSAVVRISLDDIKKQWEKQNGYCAISSIELKLSLNLSSNTVNSPMIVKKDKTKDLTKDNILWVCKPVGILMNSFDEEVTNILTKITEKL